MNSSKLLMAGIAGALLSGCAAPTKVLVANGGSGEDKTVKMLILDTGQINPTTKKKLFNVYSRVCDVDARNIEARCRDTLVIDNVVPGSVY